MQNNLRGGGAISREEAFRESAAELALCKIHYAGGLCPTYRYKSITRLSEGSVSWALPMPNGKGGAGCSVSVRLKLHHERVLICLIYAQRV